MKRRNHRAIAPILLLVAAINIQNLAASPRWEQIHTVDALRLFAAGMLIGVALVLMFKGPRLDPTKTA